MAEDVCVILKSVYTRKYMTFVKTPRIYECILSYGGVNANALMNRNIPECCMLMFIFLKIWSSNLFEF